jgi:hypothetical protein
MHDTPSKSTPITDLATLPVVITLDEIARIYRRKVTGLRRDLQLGTFRPAPFAKFPYRWLRDDVQRHLQHSSQNPIADTRTSTRRRRRRTASR